VWAAVDLSKNLTMKQNDAMNTKFIMFAIQTVAGWTRSIMASWKPVRSYEEESKHCKVKNEVETVKTKGR